MTCTCALTKVNLNALCFNPHSHTQTVELNVKHNETWESISRGKCKTQRDMRKYQ